MHRLLALALLVLFATPHHPAAAQQPGDDPTRWEEAVRTFEAADAAAMPPEGAVLFVGSSSIVGWDSLAQDFPGHTVINRGFGGSQLSDLIHYADRVILPYRPSQIVVYGGDNDLAAGKTPERVAADFRTLVERVHEELPRARILFLAVKPSLDRWQLADAVRAANDLVRRYTKGDDRLAFVDVFTPMLGPDGTPRAELFVEDGLHMSRAGYEIWREAVAPKLR